MEDKLVKTYTPVIPDGQGPMCIEAVDAIREIFADIYNAMSSPENMDMGEIESIVAAFSKPLYRVPDGTISMNFSFDTNGFNAGAEYELVIAHMKRSELDALPEFNGY